MHTLAGLIWLGLIGTLGAGVVRVLVLSHRLRRAARAEQVAAEQAERLRALRSVVAADYARARRRKVH